MKLRICFHVADCAKDIKRPNLKHRARTNKAENLTFQPRRWYHQEERNRCSAFWIPSARVNGEKKMQDGKEDSNSLLIRGGFVRKAYSGIFHLLPLGLRLQDKIERLLDKHMHGLQASKVSLSSVSSQDLWTRSGRLDGGADVFKFSDRKDAKWLLSPTHEEEMTGLVGGLVQSYRDLPLRLYQVSRKYRDEPRPRQGLLRGREFLMKDLYTFDVDVPTALRTYHDVRAAYSNFLDELKLPYIVAKADSGNMGGELSHEYHLPSSKGEDSIIRCSHCDYVQNEELVETKQVHIKPFAAADLDVTGSTESPRLEETVFVTQDRRVLVKAYCKFRGINTVNGGAECEINPYAVKAAIPEVALGIENPLDQYTSANGQEGSVLYVFDDQVPWPEMRAKLSAERDRSKLRFAQMHHVQGSGDNKGIHGLTRLQTGDQCPACPEGRIQVHKAIEIGHTFHLGTRYSKAMNLKVATHSGSNSQHETFVQMGCHGIGVSRLIAATASTLSDQVGLNWPRVIAPFEVIIIPHKGTNMEACVNVYDKIVKKEAACADAIIDDRGMDWLTKLREADLVGYPVIVFLGKTWRERGEYEVQCRRLAVKQSVPGTELSAFVKGLLAQL